MDIWGNIQQYYPFFILAFALIAFQFLRSRGRDPVKNQLELVQDLAAEVRLDVRMAEVLKTHPSPRPFMTTTWQLHKKQFDFLDESLQKNLIEAFTLAEDYNKQIIAARKQKSFESLAKLDTDKLMGLLGACKEGLEQWMLFKVGSRNPPVKHPGIFESLFGRR